LGGIVITVKEDAETLVLAAKQFGLELRVNADKSQYMVMSGDKNAGRNHSMKTDDSFFEWAEKFKYLWKTLLGNSLNKSKFYSGRNLQEIEIRQCLLPFGAEYFVFQFAI